MVYIPVEKSEEEKLETLWLLIFQTMVSVCIQMVSEKGHGFCRFTPE